MLNSVLFSCEFCNSGSNEFREEELDSLRESYSFSFRFAQERAQASFLEKIESLKNKLAEFFQLFPLCSELQQFFSEISQSPPLLNPEITQILVQIFNSQAGNFDNSENSNQFFCLLFQIIEKLITFQEENEEHIAQRVVAILGENQFYTNISFILDTEVKEIQEAIAYIYHDSLFQLDESLLSKDIFIQILKTFFQRSYIWASYQNEELRYTCLDFHLLVYKQLDSLQSQINEEEDNTEILADEDINKLQELYILLLKIGSPLIQKISLKCLSCLLICTKVISIDPQEMIPYILSFLSESNSDLDIQIFEYLAYLLALISDTQYYGENPLFPYQFFDFSDLYTRLLTSEEVVQCFICVLLNNFSKNGSEAAAVLITPEFFECAVKVFENASYRILVIFAGIFKNIFLTITSEQAMVIFQSGIIPPLLTFFSNEISDVVVTFIRSLCVASQKCCESFGEQGEQAIREAFSNVPESTIEEFLKNEKLQETMEELMENLGIEL